MSTSFQEEVAQLTAELAKTDLIRREANQWTVRLTELGFHPFTKGEAVKVYADHYYWRTFFGWQVEESSFSHTFCLWGGKHERSWGEEVKVPYLPPQFEAVLSLLAEELEGRIAAYLSRWECGCQTTTLAIAGEGWTLKDEFSLEEKCEEHSDC